MDKIISLADLKTDPKNARKHNPRNIGQITASLQQVGAARSGVIDDDGIILAGNGTYEALASAGIERVKVVEADGNEWVVVQRKGLTEEQKRILSISDNSSATLATWDGPTLEEQGIDLQPWFTPEELQKLNVETANGGQEKEGLTPPDGLEYRLIIECDGEFHQGELLRELEGRGLKCKPLIS